MTLNKNEKMKKSNFNRLFGKFNLPELKNRKETYWCLKHLHFHKYKYKGKVSQTWINCLNENILNFGGYKKDMNESVITHLTIGQSLKRYSIKSHKKSIGSRKQ